MTSLGHSVHLLTLLLYYHIKTANDKKLLARSFRYKDFVTDQLAKQYRFYKNISEFSTKRVFILFMYN